MTIPLSDEHAEPAEARTFRVPVLDPDRLHLYRAGWPQAAEGWCGQGVAAGLAELVNVTDPGMELDPPAERLTVCAPCVHAWRRELDYR